jgi:hypothetical protein
LVEAIALLIKDLLEPAAVALPSVLGGLIMHRSICQFVAKMGRRTATDAPLAAAM